MRLMLPFILAYGLTPALSFAVEPIDVQLQHSKGEYYQALVSFELLPKRKITTGARIAAARSAWALSLPDRSQGLFEEALRDPQLEAGEKARVYLSLGILEYQEGNFQGAALRAERSVESIAEAGPQRAKAWLLWGESLLRIGVPADAADKLQHALEESSLEDEGEIRFLLGEAMMQLGKREEAREHFQSIPVGHDRIPTALRRLSELAISLKDPSQVEFWLSKGRSEYPDAFLDSWVDYALGKAALEQQHWERAQQILALAQARFAASDFWVTLLAAESEGARRRGNV